MAVSDPFSRYTCGALLTSTRFHMDQILRGIDVHAALLITVPEHADGVMMFTGRNALIERGPSISACLRSCIWLSIKVERSSGTVAKCFGDGRQTVRPLHVVEADTYTFLRIPRSDDSRSFE